MDNKQPAEFNQRQLSALGCQTLDEVLLRLPKDYRDYTAPTCFVKAYETCVPSYLVLKVRSRSEKRDVIPPRLGLKLTDNQGTEGWITVFGNLFPWKEVKPGQTIHVYGTVKDWNGQYQMTCPDIVPEIERGRLAARYRGVRGRVSSDTVSCMVRAALENSMLHQASSIISAAIGIDEGALCNKIGFESICDIVRSIHAPADMRTAFRAHVAAKELAISQIKAMAQTIRARSPDERSSIQVSQNVVADLSSKLPFSLTEDQKKAISEILEDIHSNVPMRRLLSGDVGTGKSLTFMLPAIAAYEAGAVVGIMVPNVLLVNQISTVITKFFPDVNVQQVTSGKAIKLGENAILVGTTALISSVAKAGILINFLICDEQHKLSRDQREALMEGHTNYLEATATAIPRTMALITHGGLDVSVLRQMPVLKEIRTHLVARDKKRELLEAISRIIEKGGKVAIIYPRVYGSDDKDKRSIEQQSAWWRQRFPGKIGVLHGKMTDEAKMSAMDKMKNGEYSLLVASTVIETGVDIPSMRSVVVVSPERYGVSQLHQLRGRVAREGGKGYMFMLEPDEEIDQETMDRLKLVEEISDGFELAERDMESRGFGDLSEESESQTGVSATIFTGLKLRPSDFKE